MHPNSAFRPDNSAEALALARDWGFGMLVMSDPAAEDAPPLISHVPFLLDDAGKAAELHLVRSGPISRAVREARSARLVLQGPHGYVSPDWYGIEGQVPTWNYIAIHLTGTLVPLADDALPDMLARLSARFEARLTPKPEWTLDKLDPGAAARMMRQVRPFRFDVATVDSTWKLSQNKPSEARLAAADHLAAQGFGQEAPLLAALMRRPPE